MVSPGCLSQNSWSIFKYNIMGYSSKTIQDQEHKQDETQQVPDIGALSPSHQGLHSLQSRVEQSLGVTLFLRDLFQDVLLLLDVAPDVRPDHCHLFDLLRQFVHLRVVLTLQFPLHQTGVRGRQHFLVRRLNEL